MNSLLTQEAENYIYSVCDQIEYERIHGIIADELRAHIEDQTQAYLDEGLSAEDAERAAVIDMGDPVEVGKDFNRLHRPRNPWVLLVLSAVMILISLLVQFVCTKGTTSPGAREVYQSLYGDEIVFIDHSYMAMEFAKYVIIGVTAMAFIALVDYRSFNKTLRIIRYLVALIVIMRLACVAFESHFASTLLLRLSSVIRAMNRVAVPLTVVLFMPLVEEQFSRKHGFVPAYLWMTISVVGAMLIPSSSLAIVVVLSETVMLWLVFKEKDRRGVSCRRRLWIVTSMLIAFIVSVSFFAHDKTTGVSITENEWIEQLSSGRILYEENQDRFKVIVNNCKLVGGSELAIVNTETALSETMFMDYILFSIAAHFGLLPMLLIFIIVLLIPFIILKTIIGKVNLGGRILGTGIVVMLLSETVLGLLVSFGFVPLTPISIPFLSYGFVNSFMSLLMMGLCMSVYRYKDIPIIYTE